MGPFDMVAFIVLVAVIGGIIRTIVKARSGGGSGSLTAEQTARLTKLEDRVKALEAVVGDSSYELKQKLKELER